MKLLVHSSRGLCKIGSISYIVSLIETICGLCDFMEKAIYEKYCQFLFKIARPKPVLVAS